MLFINLVEQQWRSSFIQHIIENDQMIQNQPIIQYTCSLVSPKQSLEILESFYVFFKIIHPRTFGTVVIFQSINKIILFIQINHNVFLLSIRYRGAASNRPPLTTSVDKGCRITRIVKCDGVMTKITVIQRQGNSACVG